MTIILLLLLGSCGTSVRHDCQIVKIIEVDDELVTEFKTAEDCSGIWGANCTYSQAIKTLGGAPSMQISNFSWRGFDVYIEGYGTSHFSLILGEGEELNPNYTRDSLVYKSKNGEKVEFVHSEINGCHICATYYAKGGSIVARVDVFPHIKEAN